MVFQEAIGINLAYSMHNLCVNTGPKVLIFRVVIFGIVRN